MRIRWRGIGLFLLLYAICMLISLPAQLLLGFAPPALNFTQVSGTLWHGEASQLQWQERLLGKINWQWGWRNGLPVWQFALSGGDIGHGAVTVGWAGHWRLSDGRWQLPVDKLPELLGQRSLLEGSGELTLTLEQLGFNQRECFDLAAKLVWREAKLSALGQTLALGNPQLQLGCEPQRLLLALQPQQPPLQLFGKGSVDIRGAYRFNGGIGDMATLPAQWQQGIEAVTRSGSEGQRMVEVSGTWPIK